MKNNLDVNSANTNSHNVVPIVFEEDFNKFKKEIQGMALSGCMERIQTVLDRALNEQEQQISINRETTQVNWDKLKERNLSISKSNWGDVEDEYRTFEEWMEKKIKEGEKKKIQANLDKMNNLRIAPKHSEEKYTLFENELKKMIQEGYKREIQNLLDEELYKGLAGIYHYIKVQENNWQTLQRTFSDSREKSSSMEITSNMEAVKPSIPRKDSPTEFEKSVETLYQRYKHRLTEIEISKNQVNTLSQPEQK